MGFNRRWGHLPRTPPAWASTVGQIQKHGARIRASCGICPLWVDVDVAPIIARFGPDFSLWDRRPPCRSPDCPGHMLFLYSPGDSSTPFRPCKS